MSFLVSIIMPTYNSSKYISKSIESVLKQTYQNWELLITDDCSEDDTCEQIEGFQNLDARVKLFRSKFNGGAGIARNNSIGKAQGRYIAFLDSDDMWAPKKLELQINFMETRGLALSYTAYRKIDQEGAAQGVIFPPKKTTYSKLLYGNIIGCLTAIYDTSIVGKHYMPEIRKRQDMGLWLNILKEIKEAECLPEVLACYRHDTGMTNNKIKILKWQWIFYRDVVKLNIFQSSYYFFFYALNGLLKSRK
ncbi:glycosyltransferase family 2 protein [Pseudoalteromonas carrageenovora]|uniref:glycosyltransferase family 2 protein n=1 Tax=Pseudoalteromonas carrageenovora TaxID=227 RepID=UPI0026E2966B|nr:glycosyltransferase family 2 protein [Pseudoalteromonas carrageenovora]MDO6548924.1 glycosyltransferase family 2 protein [Pseudoalteromonas carrageenovora]MDO6833429.1 glycosyltransferase family 2 protein [Pseudoalteromonas carrageenovora]